MFLDYLINLEQDKVGAQPLSAQAHGKPSEIYRKALPTIETPPGKRRSTAVVSREKSDNNLRSIQGMGDTYWEGRYSSWDDVGYDNMWDDDFSADKITQAQQHEFEQLRIMRGVASPKDLADQPCLHEHNTGKCDRKCGRNHAPSKLAMVLANDVIKGFLCNAVVNKVMSTTMAKEAVLHAMREHDQHSEIPFREDMLDAVMEGINMYKQSKRQSNSTAMVPSREVVPRTPQGYGQQRSYTPPQAQDPRHRMGDNRGGPDRARTASPSFQSMDPRRPPPFQNQAGRTSPFPPTAHTARVIHEEIDESQPYCADDTDEA